MADLVIYKDESGRMVGLGEKGRRKHTLPTVQHVREVLNYDPESGIFYWKKNITTGRGRVLIQAGTVAGTVTTSVPRKPYIAININGCPRLAHRLAWLYVHGVWPTHRIDHWDGNGLNNAIRNLRDVLPAVNSQNMRNVTKGKKHGSMLGTAWHGKTRKWRALIMVDGRQKSLGYFATEAEAHAAYVAGKRVLHEGCTI